MKTIFNSGGSLVLIYFRKRLLILLLLVPINGLPQDPKIDSLRLLLEDKTRSTFGDIIYEMAKEYIMIGSYDSADKCGNKLHSVGMKQNDSLLIVRGMAINATVLGRLGYIDSAKRLYEKILPIAKRNLCLEEAKSILNSLGIEYTYEARYDIALKYHFESP